MRLNIRKDDGSSKANALSTDSSTFPLLNFLPSGGGGRGGGGGGSSGGSRGGGSSSPSSSSSSSGGGSFRPPGSSSGLPPSYRDSVGTSYGNGYTAGRAGSFSSATTAGGIGRSSISSGSTFAGRSIGGLGRGDMYGSGRYGSGYGGGYASRGLYAGGAVGGLGFPFVYWPLIYSGYGAGGYYHSGEYNRTDRPGGNVTSSVLTVPVGVDQASNNFMLYGDYNSVTVMKQQLNASCGVGLDEQANFTVTPNEAVQYYRASSFALLLEGYNNSQPLNLSSTDNATAVDTPLTPLPSTVDTNYFNCLNSTLGEHLPLPYNDDAASGGAKGVMPPHAVLQSTWAALVLVVLMTMLGR